MISFCIRTNYARPKEFQLLISSIDILTHIDKEIIITGVLPKNMERADFIYFPMIEEAKTGQTSKMRDKGFELANGKYIVALDDDIIINKLIITEDDIQIPKCYNVNGGRFYDWCCQPPIRKMDYSEPYSKNNYLSGQCFIIKAEIAKKIKHGNKLFHEGDDVDYGMKLQNAGYIFTLSESLFIHNDKRIINVEELMQQTHKMIESFKIQNK
ncbi:MAG: hypothetical protein PHF25_03480 [Candidatus Margulisbacteria bacterium]|nr:hypothetical protein [Candidatus Margulisiibacteriota bacterium]